MNGNYMIKLNDNTVNLIDPEGEVVFQTENTKGAYQRLHARQASNFGLKYPWPICSGTVFQCTDGHFEPTTEAGVCWESENNRGFKGAVLATGEENYYDDSDFYAIVWDEDEKRVRRISDGTTRAYAPCVCHPDATPEVREKAEKWMKDVYLPPIVREALQEKASKIRKGDFVKVVSGRKVPIGFEGYVAEVWESQWGWTVRVAPLGESGYLPLGNGALARVASSNSWVLTALKNVALVTPRVVSEEAVREACAKSGNCFRLVGYSSSNLFVA